MLIFIYTNMNIQSFPYNSYIVPSNTSFKLIAKTLDNTK